jgi:hypothetical protein
VRVLGAAVEIYVATEDIAAATEAADALCDVAATLDVPFARATSLDADGRVGLA